MKGQLLVGDVIDFATAIVCVLYWKGGVRRRKDRER